MNRRSTVILLFAAAILSLVLLSGCHRATPQPPSPYAPAWKAAFRAELDTLGYMPRYDLTFHISPGNGWLDGETKLTYSHREPGNWHALYFRLYPNLSRYGGSMEINGTTVDGTPVPITYEAHRTAIKVPIPETLPPNQKVHVDIKYTLKWPSKGDGVYTEFGESGKVLMLPEAYPILAVPQATDSSDPKWNLEMPAPWGDVLFSQSALYKATVTAPKDMVIAASGTEITRTVSGPSATSVWVTGPAREFAMIMSRSFKTYTTEAYGTRVTSYFVPSDAEAGKVAAEYSAAALRIYSDKIVPYPFTDFRVVEAPLTYHGMEYPEMNALGFGLYRRQRYSLEFLVAHEVGHQWWYNMVGNDQIRYPWLDEGLTEYNTVLYYEAIYGKHGVPSSESLIKNRWMAPYKLLVSRGEDSSLDKPTTEYKANDYEVLAYAKAALFFNAIREEIGDEAYDRFLTTYATRMRWKISTPDYLLSAVEESSQHNVKPLYDKWILGR